MTEVSQHDWVKFAGNFIDPELIKYTRNISAPLVKTYEFQARRDVPQKIFKDIYLAAYPGFNLTWYSNYDYKLGGVTFRDSIPNKIFARFLK